MAENLNPKDYTVALIAPREIAAQAVWRIVDNGHRGAFPVGPGDRHVYKAGDMCGHNVIVAFLPFGDGYSTGETAALVDDVTKFFPNLRCGLLVGVATGISELSEDSSRDIRLGDILVGIPKRRSARSIAHDQGKEIDDRFEPLRDLTSTDNIVQSAIERINIEALDDTRDARKPIRVWYGKIGSGDKLMKNVQKRDELRDQYIVTGLKMEAVWPMNHIPVGVIRGVCDCDGEKEEDAAAKAAAYAKALLFEIPLREEPI